MATVQSAADRAHTVIRAAITSGEIPGGTMISENDMAARIGVSRTPVRAAIVRLQDEGWLTIFPKRGALVREISAEEAWNIADARHVLEVSSVRRATKAEQGSLTAELAAILADQERQVAEGSREEFVGLDIDFHRPLVLAGQNPILLDFYDRLRDRQTLVITRSLVAAEERARESIVEHRRLLRHIENEQWDEFSKALRDHLMAAHGALFGGPRTA